jgi:deferrochelatase/peroxidase EfeB
MPGQLRRRRYRVGVTEGNLSRRRFLGIAAGGAAIGATAGLGAAAVRARTDAAASPHDAVPFDGPHQAGISTPVQDRVHFTAFDLTVANHFEMITLLKEWTLAARRLTAGQPSGSLDPADVVPDDPPSDTGEAQGLPASGLTLTIGFGPALFDSRLGLTAQRPPALADLPYFVHDSIDPARSDGDLCIQACANDPQVALHAMRQLTRIGAGVVHPRWSQLGFLPSRAVADPNTTPRNLQGFKDGTQNLDITKPALLDEHVWAQAHDGASWMAGGSYLVSRRIRMHLEPWDASPLEEQEATIGRHKTSGAPLGQVNETDAFDFAAVATDGKPRVPLTAHARLAHPDHNEGARLLRRGYSFADGLDQAGHLNAGLFFLAYQRDPRRQFVPIQRRLSRIDSLNEYISHTSSGVWACPPGVGPQGYWGDTLFL